jgi:hypothetical protein
VADGPHAARREKGYGRIMKHTDRPARKTPPPHAEPDAALGDGTNKVRRPISAAVARQIDENLKRLYRQQVEKDLPPELQALVAKLRNGEGRE